MSLVLVIEDDSAVAALLRTVLGRAGHTVIAASSGEAGIASLASERPELIILDIRLPGTDGFGVLEHTRSRGPVPPVLMLTAERGARDRALLGGADAFLHKPFDNAELVSTVRELLAPGSRPSRQLPAAFGSDGEVWRWPSLETPVSSCYRCTAQRHLTGITLKPPFSQRWTDLPLRTKGFAVLILPLILLALAVAASVDVADAQSTYQDASRAILASSDEVGQTLASMLDAETGVRGYVATGNPAFLAPWNAAAAGLGGQLRTLDASSHLTAADRRQLRDTATAEMSELHTLVGAERAAALPRARLDATLRAGKAIMDRMRAIVGRVQGRVQRELTVRRGHVDRLRTDALVIAVAGLLVGLAGVVAMFLFIRRVAARVDEVRVNAYRLGLGESLAATPVAGDELGRLAAELQQASDLLNTRSAELVQAHQAALAAATDKDRFLSRLGHELRTPLTAIVGFGQLLETSDKLDMEDADNVLQIIHATNHLMALTEEVKGAGPDETPLPLAMEPVVLAELGAEVCALMGPIASQQQVSVRLDVPADASVLANRQRLSQVLINLVSNAIKYNRPGGDVWIHCLQLATGRLRLQVTDTGAGIRAELQPRVFAPYERLEAVATEVEGTGLGLALSRAYVEAMGGAIGVQSTEGTGSTFWVDLSAAGAVEAAA